MAAQPYASPSPFSPPSSAAALLVDGGSNQSPLPLLSSPAATGSPASLSSLSSAVNRRLTALRGQIAFGRGALSRHLGTNAKASDGSGGGIKPQRALAAAADVAVVGVGLLAIVIIFLALLTNAFPRQRLDFDDVRIVVSHGHSSGSGVGAEGSTGGVGEGGGEINNAAAASGGLRHWRGSAADGSGSLKKKNGFGGAGSSLISRHLHALHDGTVGRDTLIDALTRRVGEKVRALHKSKALGRSRELGTDSFYDADEARERGSDALEEEKAGGHVAMDNVGVQKHSVPSSWPDADLRRHFVERFTSGTAGNDESSGAKKKKRSSSSAEGGDDRSPFQPRGEAEEEVKVAVDAADSDDENDDDDGHLSEEEEERLLGGEEAAVGRAMEPERRLAVGFYGKTAYERNIFDDDATFFVSISQFKDVLCPYTIHELYGKARNPRRVFVGIVDQRDDNTDPHRPPVVGGMQVRPNMTLGNTEANLAATCVPWYTMAACATSYFCPTDNIRARRTLPREGKGPTWGRYYGMLMYQGERYFLMIDSHSRFVPHWDMHSVLNLHLLPKGTRKAVMSHYPGAYEAYEELVSQRRDPWMMTMCNGHFKTFGIIRMDSEGMFNRGFPLPQYFSAGGYVFGNADYVHEVPFDPHLNFVFDGEEILYSVRLWTHGYDLFSPKNNILFHNYARHNAPRFWNVKEINYGLEQSYGQARVKYFMKSLKNGTTTNERMVPDAVAARTPAMSANEAIYGLGGARTLEDFYRRSGVDTTGWKVKKTVCDAITYNRPSAEFNVRSKNYLEYNYFSDFHYNGKRPETA